MTFEEKHSFTHEILLVNNAFLKNNELLDEINKIAAWKKSLMSNGSGAAYADDKRTSSNFEIDFVAYPQLKPYFDELQATLLQASLLYRKYNPYMYYTKNLGFEVLRYDIGEKFDEHIDSIYGHPIFGGRQASMLIYLNDDYEGGETRFLRQGIQLKPPAGSVCLFPPFYTHPHSGQPVLSGTKYIVVAWLY